MLWTRHKILFPSVLCWFRDRRLEKNRRGSSDAIGVFQTARLCHPLWHEPILNIVQMIRSLFILIIATAIAHGQVAPLSEKNIERPLRYHPDGSDFAIENGTEFFNRPLYSANMAFRVDAGDKPEFAIYAPGRG